MFSGFEPSMSNLLIMSETDKTKQKKNGTNGDHQSFTYLSVTVAVLNSFAAVRSNLSRLETKLQEVPAATELLLSFNTLRTITWKDFVVYATSQSQIISKILNDTTQEHTRLIC